MLIQLIIIAVIFNYQVSSFNTWQGNKIPVRALGPSNCTSVNFNKAAHCFYPIAFKRCNESDLSKWKLPPFRTQNFKVDTVPCSQISTMQDCLQDIPECFDFPSLYRMVEEPADAQIYLEAFVAMELKCNNTKTFTKYTTCKGIVDNLSQRDKSTLFECGVTRYGDGCFDVNRTMTCQWNLYRTVCDDISGYCTLDKTILQKQGYIDSSCVDDAIKICNKINGSQNTREIYSVVLLSLISYFYVYY